MFIIFLKGFVIVSKIIFRNYVYLFLFCRYVIFWGYINFLFKGNFGEC